jgi:ACS family hexuronate transporter-like MFS transporter
MCIASVVGYVLQWTGSYVVPFGIAAGAYLVAMAVIQLLAPRLDPPENLARPFLMEEHV